MQQLLGVEKQSLVEARLSLVEDSGVWAGDRAVSAAGEAGLGRPQPTQGTGLTEPGLGTGQHRRVCGEARGDVSRAEREVNQRRMG